jgi:hypothetical protein
MSTLDEITKEKQRVSEALARVDAQREKLTDHLSELEATERVLARYSKGTPAKKQPRPRRRPRQRRGLLQRDHVDARALRSQNPLMTSAVRRPSAIRSLPWQTARRSRKSPPHARGARPNHVGVVIARHKRAGRIEERHGKLYATQSTETMQHAAV